MYTKGVMETTSIRIKKRGSILGDQYTFKSTGVDSEGTAFESTTTILFSSGPKLVWGRSLTPIDSPWRFGSWATDAERRAYCRRFATGDEVAG